MTNRNARVRRSALRNAYASGYEQGCRDCIAALFVVLAIIILMGLAGGIEQGTLHVLGF